MVVLTLLGVGLWVGAIVVFIRALAQSQTARKPGEYRCLGEADAAAVGYLDALSVGASVSCGGVRYVVAGTVTLRQELRGYGTTLVWNEHLLQGDKGSRWLSVVRDEGRFELVLWTPRDDLDVHPFGAQLVDGEIYRDHERNRALYTTRGATGLPERGQVAFVDYASADNRKFLGFRQWVPGMPREIRTGRVAHVNEFNVGPAAGIRTGRPLTMRQSTSRGRGRRDRTSRQRMVSTPYVWRKRFTSSPFGVVLHGMGQTVLQMRNYYSLRADPRDGLFFDGGILAIAGTYLIFLGAMIA